MAKSFSKALRGYDEDADFQIVTLSILSWHAQIKMKLNSNPTTNVVVVVFLNFGCSKIQLALIRPSTIVF